MNTLILRERGELESDLARAWWQLAPRTLLSLEDGQRCLLLYSGQPGGPAGPDVHDAVLRFPQTAEGTQLVGDVEFHLRASDWFTHRHHTDPRYNQVVLHVVLYLDGKTPTRRQDGRVVPTCSLLDRPQAPQQSEGLPCQHTPLTAQEIATTLLYAGLQRFNEKSQALRQTLAEVQPQPGSIYNAYDTCLLPALAEGLGYGRDRAFFRAAGQRVVGLPTRLPEPLGHTQFPAPLDARRLRILSMLSARWRQAGAWHTLRQALRPEQDVKATTAALRAALQPLGQARADILIVNIVLPFAAAIAELENDLHLAARAQRLFLAYPRKLMFHNSKISEISLMR